MPAIPPLPQALSDGVVALRFTAERDIPEILIAYQEDPQLHVRLRRRRPPSGAELGQELEAAAADRMRGSKASLAILEVPGDQCRGEITIHEIDWERARASAGIWVAPQARGRGIARRALRLAVRWLLDGWGLEQITLLTDADNEAMLRAARAVGFVRGGELASDDQERGERGETAVLSLFRGDPQSSAVPMSSEATPGSSA